MSRNDARGRAAGIEEMEHAALEAQTNFVVVSGPVLPHDIRFIGA